MVDELIDIPEHLGYFFDNKVYHRCLQTFKTQTVQIT